MVLQFLFHLVGAVQFCYGCYYDYTYVNIPSTSRISTYGGKLKYLTFINAMLQTMYFTVSALNDLFGTTEPIPPVKPLIRRIKDFLFSTLAFPLAMFVGITFWSIYAVDRELILPKMLDKYFPMWLNHVMHTNIMLFTLVEIVTSFRMYPNRRTGLGVLTVFMIFYMIWIHIIYFETEGWVYPILAALNWPLRIAFYLVNLGLVCGLYSLGESLNRFLWQKEIDQTVKSKKKKVK